MCQGQSMLSQVGKVKPQEETCPQMQGWEFEVKGPLYPLGTRQWKKEEQDKNVPSGGAYSPVTQLQACLTPPAHHTCTCMHAQAATMRY